MRVSGKAFLAILLTLTPIVSLFTNNDAGAAQITDRNLTLMTSALNVGGSTPGGIVNHRFNFTLPTNATVGSIRFEYCTIASVEPCVAPRNMNATSATLAASSGLTGFTMGARTNNSITITRSPTSGSGSVSYTFENVRNPEGLKSDGITPEPNYTFFVRITTYDGANATGNIIDSGSVAASTASQIVLTGVMPESLVFCAGGSIPMNGNIPNCSGATSGAVTFNRLFSPEDTATARSEFAASTNALNGYSVSVSGPTMTMGASTIAAMQTAGAGVRGTNQFGMNLATNTTTTSTPAVGAAITPTSNTTDLRAQAMVDYNQPDVFKFVPAGEVIANSGNDSTPTPADGTAGPTNAQRYTASYIVNVAGSLLPGTYTTTLTYVCTANF